MTAEAVGLLKTQRLWQEQMKRWRAEEELGIEWPETDLIFTSFYGMPLARNSFMYALRRVCRAAGVQQLAPHELRHTGVSLLISMNYNVKQIQELAGHTSVTTTLDEYGHLFPADIVGAMGALSDSLTTNDSTWRAP